MRITNCNKEIYLIMVAIILTIDFTVFIMEFIKGTIEDDSKGVDGFLNNKPYNVKSSTYKNKHDK